jgi:hypothetical protein
MNNYNNLIICIIKPSIKDVKYENKEEENNNNNKILTIPREKHHFKI